MKKVLIATVVGLAAVAGAHQGVTVNGHAPKTTTIKSPDKGKVKTVNVGKKKRKKFLGIF